MGGKGWGVRGVGGAPEIDRRTEGGREGVRRCRSTSRGVSEICKTTQKKEKERERKRSRVSEERACDAGSREDERSHHPPPPFALQHLAGHEAAPAPVAFPVAFLPVLVVDRCVRRGAVQIDWEPDALSLAMNYQAPALFCEDEGDSDATSPWAG